ncbi:hypothetical protein D3C80_1440560 [compost metagenome]
MFLDLAAPADAVEQLIVLVEVLYPFVEQLHREEHWLFRAQQGLGGSDVLVHAQHHGNHVLAGETVEAGRNDLADQRWCGEFDLVRRILDVGHLGAEHRIGQF